MKITAITSFAYKGEHVESGATIEVPDLEAKQILGTGRAKRAADEPAAPVIETAEAKPAVETAEATPVRKKR